MVVGSLTVSLVQVLGFDKVYHRIYMKRMTYLGVAQSPYNDYLLAEINKYFDLEQWGKCRRD